MDCIHRHQELREVPSPALAAARGLGLRSRPNGGAQRGADGGAGGVTEGACRGASGWNITVSTLFQRCFLHFLLQSITVSCHIISKELPKQRLAGCWRFYPEMSKSCKIQGVYTSLKFIKHLLM